MHTYIKPITEKFESMANAGNAAAMKAYMKNQFEFFGIKMPERRAVCKAYMKQNELLQLKELTIIIKELWKLAEREYQYFAIELMAYHKKVWKPLIIDLFEYCITNKSWWDAVDFIANDCAGVYFKMYPEKIFITERWNRSDNMWLQRSSLLFQNRYKQQTDTALLEDYILHFSTSKQFFIKKAIGWCLREYSKTNAQWVLHFAEQHTLQPLSRKEALRNIHVEE